MDSVGVVLATLGSLLIAEFLLFFLQGYRLKRYVKYNLSVLNGIMERRATNLNAIKKTIATKHPNEKKLTAKINKIVKKMNNATTIDDVVKIERNLPEIIQDLVLFITTHRELMDEPKLVKAQSNLLKIEKKIEPAKEAYNNSVVKYNAFFMITPQKIVAKVFKFSEEKTW